ncbi:MAG: IS3 family transposase, partial [Pseudomonadota bacterium]
SGGVLCQAPSVRYAFISKETANCPVKLMCRVLEVHEQGYYQWRRVKRDLKAKRKKRLCVMIRHIFYSHKRRYGSPRV